MESFTGQNSVSKIKWLFFLLAFEMPFMLIAIFLQNLLFKNGLVNSENHFVNELIHKGDILFVTISILILPFIEELIFRLPLRFKKGNFIPCIIFIILLSGMFLFEKLQPAVSVPLFLGIAILLSFYFFHRRMAEKREAILYSNYPLYFYFVAILFALAHLANFSYSISLLLFAPIIVLPQFAGGFFMGFIRIKQGFIWGFFLHALHNAIFMLPVLLFSSINNPKLIEKIDKNDYTFEVYEGFQFNSPEYAKSEPVTSPRKITPNEIVLYGTFKNVVSTLTITNKKYIRFKNSILLKKKSVYILKMILLKSNQLILLHVWFLKTF